MFGDQLPLAERLAAWLSGAAITRGLIGPREADRIWERHILNGVAAAELIRPGAVVIDLGSGAGLPGVPLLLARPDLQLILVEPKARRVAFLRELCADLGLPARVVRARAGPGGLVALPEGWLGATAAGEPVPPADVVTARAVAPLPELGRWAVPLLRPGGLLLAIKGSSASDELARSRGVLARLGLRDPEVLTFPAVGDGGTSEPLPATTVIAMTLGLVSRET